MTYTGPLKLDAQVAILGMNLILKVHGAEFTLPLANESVDWIWQDVLKGGDRRDVRIILEAAVTLKLNGVEIIIGAGPDKWPMFKWLPFSSCEILWERQTKANEGTAPEKWEPVRL